MMGGRTDERNDGRGRTLSLSQRLIRRTVMRHNLKCDLKNFRISRHCLHECTHVGGRMLNREEQGVAVISCVCLSVRPRHSCPSRLPPSQARPSVLPACLPLPAYLPSPLSVSRQSNQTSSCGMWCVGREATSLHRVLPKDFENPRPICWPIFVCSWKYSR